MLRRVALVGTNVSEELKNIFLSVRRLLLTANVVPSLPILVILMKEALSFSETSVLTRATRRNIPEDTILHSHRRENLKFYMLIMCSYSAYYFHRDDAGDISSEMSVLTRATRSYIPQDGILHSYNICK
jgi:hypothetical protein